MLWPLALSTLVWVSVVQGQSPAMQVCSKDMHHTDIGTSANVIIGGIYDLRGPGSNGFGCGQIIPDLMQVLEASRFMISTLNRANYVPGVTFGMRVYDTCREKSVALKALQDLYPQTTSSNPFCTRNTAVILGAVGPLYSSTAVPVAKYASSIPASLISPRAASPALSDKTRFPTFLRSVTSFVSLAKTTVELLKALQWEENILLVYSDDEYGHSGYRQLLQAAYNRDICFAKAIAVDPMHLTKDSAKAALGAVGSTSYAVGVIVMSFSEGQTVLDAIDEIPSFASTQWIVSDMDMTSRQDHLFSIRGALIVTPGSPTISGFRTFFAQEENKVGASEHPENPWFVDWYERRYSCWITAPRGGLPQCTSQGQANLQSRFVQSPFAVPTMKAIGAYAEAVREICSRQGGSCLNQLRSMRASDFQNTLKNLDVSLPSTFPIAELRGERLRFDANGDLESYDCAVYNYNSRTGVPVFEQIGELKNNVFTLSRQPFLYDSSGRTSLPVNPVYRCPAPGGCTNCLKPEISTVFRYSPGDVVIASLANAHMPGKFPFTCGTGVPSDLAALVAAEWAAARYKAQNPSKLQQVSLGSLVVDICPDGLVASGFLTDLLSGNNRLLGPAGSVVTADNIRGFVDHTDGQQARMISPVLAQYRLPEIQTDSVHMETMMGGPGSMMSGGNQSAYMIQAVPNDHMLHEAISSLLLRMGWNYVQVVTHGSGMYHAAAEDFRMTAGRHGICVVSMVDNLDSADAARFSTALARLRSRPEAPVVVVIAAVPAVRGLLEAIQTQGAGGSLQLVAGTEEWARNSDLINGVEAAARGSLLVELEMDEWTAFTTWLRAQSPSDIVDNPFLSELFEVTNQCSLGPSSRGSYDRVCGFSETINTVSFGGMGKIPYVIQSVYTMADKLHEVIVDLCTSSYSGLCSSFRSSGDIGALLNAKLQNVDKLANGYGIRDGKSSTNFVFSQYNGVYNRFAEYSNENRRLVSFDSNAVTVSAVASTCAGACIECQYLFALQGGVFSPGDWLVAGIFSVSDPGPQRYQPYVCGDIRTTNGPQYTTAMMYALQQVNSGAAPVSVRGVTFGGIILDHCNNPGRANLLASSIYSNSMMSMGLDESHILSWLTDNSGVTQEAEALLEPLDVAVVSPSATNMDLMDYSNFHRTIQGDQTVASALVKILQSLGYAYFQVVYSDSAYGEGSLKILQNIAQSEGLCITNSLKVSDATAAAADNEVRALLASDTHVVVFFTGTSHTRAMLEAIARNANARNQLFVLLAEPFQSIVKSVAPGMRHKIMSLRLQTGVLQRYNDFLNRAPVSNPYFAQYYMKLMQCDLPGFSTYSRACPENLVNVTSAADYAQDNFILSTINAVYATVDALDRTVTEYCGAAYTEPCQEFLAAPDKRRRFNQNLARVRFVDEAGNSFRFLDREGNVMYDILQSNAQGDYTAVATYAGVSLDLDGADTATYHRNLSECSPPCQTCVMQAFRFSHTPGDIYLAGVFDVHESSLTIFTCDKINTLHGFLLLEAFHYALNQVNSKEGQFADILPGVKLGGIGIDACQSRIRGGYLVSNINNGMMTLARDGVVIDPSEIDAYIGSYGSRDSIYLAQILNDLEMPQISYAAGNPDLSDDRYYPYFYRTVPSDENMVDAILKFLDTEDMRYVQVVFEDTLNAVVTKDYFMEKASSYRICVAQAVNYPDIGTVSDETATSVVSRLIEKPAANMVVTFLDTRLVSAMLAAVQRSERARGKLRFFGSDAWADNQDAIAGRGQQAVNSITVKLDSDEVEGFERYISGRSLANSDENPWFAEYYQAIHNCYVSRENKMGYPDPCSLTLADITNQRTYQQDQGVAYVMDAVYAAAFGLHETLKEKCNNGYTTVCQGYRNDVSRREILKDKLKDVSFTDPLGANFQFVNRSGNYGYRYYAVTGATTYNQIGTYDVNNGDIAISPTYENTINSNCERKDTCSECPLIRDHSTRYVTFNGPNPLPSSGAKMVVAFFDIHKQGVDPYRCGDINPEGFQQFLAFFYSLEKVLGRSLDSQIRVVAIDTCSNSLRVDQDLYGLLAGDGLCNSQFEPGYPLDMANLGSVITLGELNTMAAARVLEAPGVTYVSPNALSPMLDSYPHLVRSIAPTSAMMKALADLLTALGMSYVDVVYENNMQGYQTMDRLSFYAYDARVCLASSLSINEDSTDEDIETALAGLRGDLGSKAVVLIGSHTFARRVLNAAARLGVADDYLWVVVGHWEPTQAAINLLGAASNVKIMTVRRRSWDIQTFRNHVNQLAYSNVHAANSRTNVPPQWYDEFYQLQFNCTLPTSERPLGGRRPVCDTSKTFSEVNWTPDPYVINTVAAGYAVGEGLTEYLRGCSRCRFTGNLAPDMPARMILRDSILDVEWNMMEVLLNSDFHQNRISETLEFDEKNRWWDQGHVFTAHWAADPSNADFTSPVGSTELDMLRAMLDGFSESKCSQSAGEGSCGCFFTEVQAAQAQRSTRYQPSDHRNYYEYNSSGGKTFDWPVWTLPVSALTAVGLVMTVILFLILICTYPVRGGTSVLGYMSILGILCIYAVNFAFFFHATDVVCGIRRFLMGVVYMVALGPMLVKAVDNWRFSHTDQAEGRYSGISSACSLLMAAIGLVLIQCIVPIMWLILRHPTASELVMQGLQGAENRHDNWWCDPADDYDLGLLLSFGFVLFVVIVTAGFCALAFDSGRNNYEARWILLSCVATGGCFLVWMVVITNAGPPYRDPAVAIANVVNATLLLITMPLRKTILMCRARRAKYDDEDKSAVYYRNGGSQAYGSRFNNPTYDLNYYDNTFMDSKSEEF